MTINAREAGMPLAYHETIMDVKNALEMYAFPDSLAVAVAQRLPILDAWMTTLLPQTKGLHIDIIGQTHTGGPENDAGYQYQLLESQGLIKGILLANRYAIVGDEGIALVQADKGSYLKGDYGMKRKEELEPPSQDQVSLVEGTYGMLRSAVSSLAIHDPTFQSKIIGIEDVAIYNLHGFVVGQKKYEYIDNLLIILRSDIAFFKVAESMIRTKARTAGIVIGAAHLMDFVWLARATGAIVDFYYTCNGSGIPFFKYMTQRE